MKKILSLLVLLAGITAVHAQEKSIQKSDFEAVIKSATDILKTTPHRITVTQKTDVNGKSQENSSAIVEVASSDKLRSVRETKSLNQNSKREFVRIGDKSYSRENDGQWKQAAMPVNPNEGMTKTVDEQLQYQSLGKETLNNLAANVYVKTKTSKMIDSSNNREILSTEKVKYWFDGNGALIKREMARENRVGEKTFHFMTTAVFDYDKNIQVVAPAMAVKQ